MGAITDAAIGLGSQMIGGGIGAGVSAIGNAMGQSNSKKLIKQQVGAQKELTDYNQAAALKMWKDTNYGAQMKEITGAGLSPGLIYGGSGAGGATASVSPGSATAAPETHSSTNAIMSGMGGIVDAMQRIAQTANTQADTINKETTKPNIEADTANKQATKPNIEADTVWKDIQNNMEKNGTIDGENPGVGGNAWLKAEILDKENAKKTWEAEAERINVKQMPEQLKIAWQNAAANATHAAMAIKNANTNEQRMQYERQLEQQRQDLQKKLFDMGMDQRKVEFITNSVFRGVEAVTGGIFKFKAGQREDRRLDQNDTRMNEWSEWHNRQ